jgi:diacylglycerol O-acyltransferase
VFGALLRTIDVDVVDLVGFERPPYLAGARIDRLWAFAPPTGAALSVTLLSHGRTACVALACDRAAVDDPDLMAACLEHGFDEVAALGRPPRRRRRRSPAAAASGGAG